jgi:redox-sensitive bicupin YhaK (pirin superfamily)
MKEKVIIRRSEERFYEDMGWLKSKFTFSFANYFDVKFMNFCSLKVINEDVFEPL